MENRGADNDEDMAEIGGLSSGTPVEGTGRESKTARFYKKREDGQFECLICPPGTFVAKDKDSCTSSRWRHLRKFHPRQHASITTSNSMQRTLDAMFGRRRSTQLKYPEISEQSIREECARFVTETDNPFTIVESKALKRFASFFAQRDITLPSSRITREDAFKFFEEKKGKLRKVLQLVRKVALTVDGWTATNGANMLGVTVHWVDDEWNLCERVLHLTEIDGPHSGEYMAELMFTTLNDFGIMEKVIAITTDNAANNGTMMRKLGQSLARNGIKSFKPEHHMPCVTHIFNLAVQDGLKNLGIESAPTENEIFREISEDTCDVIAGGGSEVQVTTPIGKIVRRLRRMIIAIKMSPVNTRRYEVLCESNNLPDSNKLVLDCKTRWNSTLDMITKALAKKVVLHAIAEDVLNIGKDNYTITTDEWTLLEEFSQMLVPFAEATELTSTSKRLSISIVMSIVAGIFTLLEADMTAAKDRCTRGDPTMTPSILSSLQLAYEAMIAKLSKYNEIMKLNPVYVIATCLDPRHKLTSVPPGERQVVRDKLLSLLDAEGVIMQSTQPQVAEGTSVEETSRDPSVSSPLTGKQSRRLTSFIPGWSVLSNQTVRTTTDEVNEYLSEVCISDNDALGWWKQVGRFRFPKIAELAKDYLCICATSAPSERLFSVGRGIVTYKRARLLPETMGMLMSMRCWARDEVVFEDIIDVDN